MGRQSQQRISNTKRAFSFADSTTTTKRKKGDQTTLFGGIAFDAERDCVVCSARARKIYEPTTRVPKREHDKRCIKNTTTKGMGEISREAMATLEEEKQLKKLFEAPLADSEKGSAKHTTADAIAAFLAPRPSVMKKPPAKATANTSNNNTNNTAAIDGGDQLCKAVATLVNNTTFVNKHQTKGAPLAMVAFAETVCKDGIGKYLPKNGITITVPRTSREDCEPHYHSIIGQKLHYVEWQKRFGITIKCPDGRCSGHLQNDRTNYSKNKQLFPIYTLEGAPSWAIVMSMVCSRCKRRFDANTSDVLLGLPDYVSTHYPVDIKYAVDAKSSHIAKSTTQVFNSIMVTYGNGELCSRLLYDAINRNYLERISVYYSFLSDPTTNCPVDTKKPYIPKDGTYIRQYPPTGVAIRDLYDIGAHSNRNRWGISDNERNTREIQSVQCNAGIFAQDHTFEAVKNYQKKIIG